MSDDELTRAIAEALGCERDEFIDQEGGRRPFCNEHGFIATGWPCPQAEDVADALAPLIEARVREARADALAQVSEVLDASTAKFDRAVGGPTEPTRFVRDTARNLRNDAEEIRRG